jgi:hypothetical protein
MKPRSRGCDHWSRASFTQKEAFGLDLPFFLTF